jgi:hypothetical protein
LRQWLAGLETTPSRIETALRRFLLLIGQLDNTSKLTISPGSHSAWISMGRQQTSQSVTNRWLGTLVSTVNSER